jgi:hypothetical protein
MRHWDVSNLLFFFLLQTPGDYSGVEENDEEEQVYLPTKEFNRETPPLVASFGRAGSPCQNRRSSIENEVGRASACLMFIHSLLPITTYLRLGRFKFANTFAANL